MTDKSDDKQAVTKKRRGGPPPTGMDNRKHSGTVCTATRRDGPQRTNFAIKGASVCRMHGGSAPQVRRAAQVRLLMQADNLMAALLEIALDDEQPVQARLVAIRDGLDRANLSGTQSVELTVEKGKTFEDWVGEAIIDVEADDESNVVLAEVIEADTTPLIPRDEVQTRHDRSAFAEVERARSTQPRPGMLSDAERARREAEAFGSAPRQERRKVRRSSDVQAMNAQQDAEDAELKRVKAAERRRNEDRNQNRRARISEATMSQPRRRGESG